jgi:hypothetical protein
MRKSFFIATLMAVALVSCNNGNGNQPVVQPVPQQQPAATVDSTVQQPAAAPVQNQAAQGLPEPINSFIAQQFPNASIVGVDTDNGVKGLKYEVVLNDGTEVEFDVNNQWDKVDCHMKAVPAALVPAAIANYVKTNFQGVAITKIDKELYGYEIELANDLNLKFSADGQFMGADD